MPRGSKKKTGTTIDTYKHEGKKRKNNPPVGLVSTSTDKLNGRTKYQHDPHIDPTLSWAGKKEGMSVEVQNVSLHIHERIDPSRIVKSFLKPQKQLEQLSLFDEPENNPPLVQAIDFHRIRLFLFMSQKFLRWNVWLALAVMLGTNALLLQSRFFQWTFAVQLGFYALACAGPLLNRVKIPGIAIPYYFCIINLAAFIGFWRFVSRKQKASWEPLVSAR